MKTLSFWLALLCFATTTYSKNNVAKAYTLPACSIDLNPQSLAVCAGLNTSFTVGASGSNLTYKWQVDVGFGYLDLKASSTFSDIDKATLVVSNVTTLLDGYKFRCIVGGDCVPELISGEATLSVLTAPSINSHPASSTVCQNSTAYFQANVSGSNLAYQWQEDKGDGQGFKNLSDATFYEGSNSSVLSISNVLSYFGGYKYRSIVSGACSGTVITNSATLTVNPLINITGHPQTAYTCANKPENERTVSYTVEAEGPDLTYQWQVDAGFGFVSPPTTPIHSGINTKTLTVAKVNSSFNGYIYRCIVTSSCGGSRISNEALLVVNSGSAAQPSQFTESSEVVFAGQQMVRYSVPEVEGATSYEWTYKNQQGGIVPGVAIYGDGTSSVTVDYGSNAVSGNLSVCSANGCGLSAPRTLAVNVQPASVLPVSLVSYSAQLNNNGSATIRWTTAQESDNDHFTVSHSTDGINFTEIGNVASKGTGASYSFIHRGLAAGINYYKLTQVNKNSGITELGIKAVNVALVANSSNIYPNPLSGRLLTVSVGSKEKSLPVIISNLNGQLIFSKQLEVKDGLIEIEFVERPAQGVYVIRVGGNMLSKKLLVN